MEQDQLIPADLFCVRHNIEISFINSLDEIGLIEVVRRESVVYIDPVQLGELEKFVRLRYELDINLEGVEAIAHLLKKIGALQAEVSDARNRLRRYE